MDGVVVVTGANGHIGNNLCKELVSHGYRVKGTVRSLDKAPDIKIEFAEADVLKPEDWPEILEGASGLFHLATIYSTSEDGQLILDTANLGTENVFRAAAAATKGTAIEVPSTVVNELPGAAVLTLCPGA